MGGCSLVYRFARTTVTKYHKVGCLKSRNLSQQKFVELFRNSPKAQKSKVLVRSVPSEVCSHASL